MKIKESKKLATKKLNGRTIEIWYDPDTVLRCQAAVACAYRKNDGVYAIALAGTFFRMSKMHRSLLFVMNAAIF